MQYPLAEISNGSDTRMLKPRFKKRFQGYDPTEVDALIDNWQKKIVDLSEQNIQQAVKLQAAYSFIEKMEEQRSEEAHGIVLAMTVAKKTAERIISEAEVKAADLEHAAASALSVAHIKAKRIIEEAGMEAAERRAALNEESAMIEGAIAQKLSATHEMFAQLAMLSDTVKSRLTEMLDDVTDEANKALVDISGSLPAGFQLPKITPVLQVRNEVVTVTST